MKKSIKIAYETWVIIIFILFAVFCCSGCSLLKSVIAPLTPVINTLPQETSKSKDKVICKGKIEYDINGNIKSCSKGYKNYGYKFNEQERKLNWKEKIAQTFTRLSGWLIIGGFLLLLAGNGLFGAFLGRLVGNMFGEGKAFFATMRGIAKGKKYVRSNGSKYTPEEKKIYEQGMTDFMKVIEEEQKNSGTQKLVDKLRGKVK